jgi:hypothetical protein
MVHDILLALAFLAMIVTPALVSMGHVDEKRDSF